MGSDDEATARSRYMALTAALLGWMFDGLEMGLFPLVARPALNDLLHNPGDAVIGRWFGVATAGFLVGAATGGVLFGWLGDRLGRVRALTFSVLTYAVFSGLCGVATAAWQIAFLRFVSALGMGGEWSLGVALVMEVWPNRSRALMAGLIGAAANFGYMFIALLGLGLGRFIGPLGDGLRSLGLPESWAASLVGHSGWRLLMLLGATPALLTFLIRLFVPESSRWQHEKAQGRTTGWAARDLVGVLIGAAVCCALIALWAADLHILLGGIDWTWAVRLAGSALALAVVTVCYLYPVVRYLVRSSAALTATSGKDLVGSAVRTEGPAQEQTSIRTADSVAGIRTADPTDRVRAAEPADDVRTADPTAWGAIVRRMLLGACLSGVPLLATWAAIQWAPVWADQLAEQEAKAKTAATGIQVEKDPEPKAYAQISSALGAILGTVLAAFLGDWIGRRLSYAVLCLTALGSALLFFRTNDHVGGYFLATVFLAGACTASFYGWLPLYLPELFPTRVRATGQGFSFNFGRILAAVGTLQTGALMKVFDNSYPDACSRMSLIYLAGLVLIWFVPETRGRPLPE
jgi:MFS family permease